MYASAHLRVRQGLDAERLLRGQPGLLADRRQVRRDAVEREAEALHAHDPQGLQQRAQRQRLIAGRHAAGGGRRQTVRDRAVDRLPNLVDRLATAFHNQGSESDHHRRPFHVMLLAGSQAVMADQRAVPPLRSASADDLNSCCH